MQFKITFAIIVALCIGINHSLVAINVQAHDGGEFVRCSPFHASLITFDETRENHIKQLITDRAESDPVIQKLLNIQPKGINALRSASAVDDGKNVTIPIVFHIIQETKNDQTVPLSAISAQIDRMNVAYSGRDGQGGFTDSGIRFSLQAVNTIVNKKWFNECASPKGETPMKKKTSISPERYLNVWSCDMGTTLGFAYLPTDIPIKSYLHGIVMNYQSFPEVSGYKPLPAFNEGDTLVHEAGHYLGLLHTFDGGCSTRGDGISDTAAEASPAKGRVCFDQVARDSCPDKPGVDPVTNFMDYSDDICMTNFTPLQSARMRTMLFQYRTELTQNQNRECVSGGNKGNVGSWKMCTSQCFTTKTPDNNPAPSGGWCYTSSKKKQQWGDCCCVENGCTPKSNIYGM